MPPCCWRSRPAPCPPRLGGRRPRRRLFLPPPPEGRPGPAFILFSCVSCIQSARKADANLLSLLAALWMVPCATHNQLARKPQFKWNSRLKIFVRYAPGASGRGGPAREHGRWEQEDGTPDP